VAGSCEYGDKPAGSGARELENFHLTLAIIYFHCTLALIETYLIPNFYRITEYVTTRTKNYSGFPQSFQENDQTYLQTGKTASLPIK
jgi:hypothetical protein